MTRLGFAPLALVALCASCATYVPPPEPGPDAPDAMAPEQAWQQVLARFVDDRGRVGFAALAREPGALEVYVAWLATHGPETDPERFATQEARLAHYINAYNALSMYNVLHAGVPPHLEGLRAKAEMFYFREMAIDGERRSLHELETESIRTLGDPRVHFALNCMTGGCPILPREAFSAAGIDARLDREARRFCNDERNVRVDHARKVVHLSELFDLFEDDFLAVAPSLIAYVNRYRDEKLPEGYEVELIPFDWTIKSAPSGEGPPEDP